MTTTYTLNNQSANYYYYYYDDGVITIDIHTFNMELVIVISPYSRIIPLPRPLTRIATLTAQGIIAPLFLHRPRPRGMYGTLYELLTVKLWVFIDVEAGIGCRWWMRPWE